MDGRRGPGISIQKTANFNGPGTAWSSHLALDQRGAATKVDLAGKQAVFIELTSPGFTSAVSKAARPAEAHSVDIFFASSLFCLERSAIMAWPVVEGIASRTQKGLAAGTVACH